MKYLVIFNYNRREENYLSSLLPLRIVDNSKNAIRFSLDELTSVCQTLADRLLTFTIKPVKY